VEFGVFVLGTLGTSTLLGIKVILALGTSQKLAFLRDFDALAIRLVGFHRHGIAVLYSTYLSRFVKPACR
jgi:hypothetical protein